MAEPSLYDDLLSSMPWLADLGISPAWLQETAATSASSAEILQKIRETEGYKRRFAGLKRSDGSLRMNEGQYIQTENAFRQNLRYFGYDVDRDFNTPESLVKWFQAETAPDEQRTRLEVLDQVKKSSALQRDTYYVYTGRELSIEDLYGAKMDEEKARELYNRYRQATSMSPTYEEFITRATQVALGRLTETGQGSIDPEFARSLMDQIHHGSADDAINLPLADMLASFDYAMIGSSAVSAGLGLPTKERLAEIRAAGVERQAAIEGYTQFGQNKGRYDAAVQRATGRKFTQSDFESSQFLHDAEDTEAFTRGVRGMEAAGKSQGSFRFDESDSGRFVQRGLSAR